MHMYVLVISNDRGEAIGWILMKEREIGCEKT